MRDEKAERALAFPFRWGLSVKAGVVTLVLLLGFAAVGCAHHAQPQCPTAAAPTVPAGGSRLDSKRPRTRKVVPTCGHTRGVLPPQPPSSPCYGRI